jgi:glyoxylase-like metal-dependent hydrolase (beta-lactamase superfamily II)
MIFERLVVGPLGVNCYIVGDAKTREVIIVDPGGNARDILDTLRREQVKPVAIVNTHAHFDHLIGLNEVREKTGAPFWIHAAEAQVLASAQLGARMFGFAMAQPKPADRLLHDGEVMHLGALSLQVLHTPGHTPGGICLRGDTFVIVGDTLFQGSIGRTDLPGGDYATLMASIRDKLMPLPDETVVYPGHGERTTMGEEKVLNPFLRPLITGQWNV